MKIISKFNILMGGLLALSLLSCAEDQSYDFPSSDKPIVTPTDGTTFSVTEGETLNIPFKTSRAISEPMTFKFIVQAEGTAASMSLDYSIGDGVISSSNGNPATTFEAVVPAYAETFEIPFMAFSDLELEGVETVVVKMEATDIRTALTQDGGIIFTINIAQLVSNNFIFHMDWGADYVGTDGETYNLCGYDLDLEIYDSTGANIVATSYSSCPEEIVIAPGDLPDGDYLLMPSYYSPSGAVLPDATVTTNPTSIPAVITIAKPGVFNETIDLTGVWTDFAAGAAENNPDAYQLVGILNIAGTTYTVTDPTTGAVIVQGRMGTPVTAKTFTK